MRVRPTQLEGVKVIEPRMYVDARGFFMETWNESRYRAANVSGPFLQDSLSRSVRQVLRGLHYQVGRPQGKLIWVIRGEVFDVGVDLRRSSPTFGQWTGIILSDTNHRQVYLPPGFAHGFCVLSAEADVAYKCTEVYAPELERGIIWNDPQLCIEWPLQDPVLSDKDCSAEFFSNASYYP
jgi:dTDP-4-dehydrorhamnose 3,5-epimerase